MVVQAPSLPIPEDGPLRCHLTCATVCSTVSQLAKRNSEAVEGGEAGGVTEAR